MSKKTKAPAPKNAKAKGGKKPKMAPVNIWPTPDAKTSAKAEWAQVVQESKLAATTSKATSETRPQAQETRVEAKPKKLSGLEAAAKVLAEAGTPMNTKDMVDTAAAKGYWSSNGKTPAATIYAAIIREISKKGTTARFKKTERGLFTIA